MATKLIAIDLDGTLLQNNHIGISQKNIDAIREASKKGVKIAIATGRPNMMVEDTIEAVGVVDYLINSNGAKITDLKNNKIIYNNNIPVENWHFAYDLIKKENVLFDVYARGRGYVEERFRDRYSVLTDHKDYNEYFMEKYEFHEDLKEYLHDDSIEKITIMPKNETEKNNVLDALIEKNSFVMALSLGNSFEINDIKTSKGKALNILCKEMGIDISEIMAFGDGDNDSEMLTMVGCGIAMGNGMDKLKSLADYVTDTNDQDGVAKGIEKYLEA